MAKCEVEVLAAFFCYLEAQDVFLVPAFPSPCQARLEDQRANPSSHEPRRSEALPRGGGGEEERGGGRPSWRRATPPLTTHGLLGVRGGGVSKSIEVRRVVDIASQARQPGGALRIAGVHVGALPIGGNHREQHGPLPRFLP